MISQEEAAYITERFSVYEHNWSLYSRILGTPALVDDMLCYCDGMAVYVAAFPLSRPGAELSSEEAVALIEGAIKRFPRATIGLINIWGRFSDLPLKSSFGESREFNLISQSEYYLEGFDSVFDVQAHLQKPAIKARKRIKSSEEGGIQTSLRVFMGFNYEHLAIIESWMSTHVVSQVHKEFIFALESHGKGSSTYICEARIGESLVGFSIIAVVSSSRLVVLNSFPLRRPGMRAGDALFSAVIKFASSRNARFIHRGYSATKSLLETKESWGSTSRSLPYREAFYSANQGISSIVESGRFLWKVRLS